MPVKVSLLLFILLVSDCFAREKSLPVASDAITFEQNFDDKSVLPEMASGQAKPILILGKLKYVKGIKGNALYCGAGGAKIRYLCKDNLDFSKPGAVSFWFFTDNWQNGIGKHRTLFFATESSKGYIGSQIANSPKSKSPLERKVRLWILYSSKIPNCYLDLPPLGMKGNMQWHLIVLAWASNKLYMSCDGAPFTSKTIKGKITPKALPSTHFSIGSNDSQNYFLDELKIYSRKLSGAEIKQLWSRFKVKNNNIKKKKKK